MNKKDGARGMKVSFEAKFKFGEEVQYESEINGSGSGIVRAVEIDEDGVLRYVLELPDGSWQPGILEEEMEIWSADT